MTFAKKGGGKGPRKSPSGISNKPQSHHAASGAKHAPSKGSRKVKGVKTKTSS